MRIEIEKLNGEYVVTSLELYKLLKLHPQGYSQWVKRIIRNGVKNKDYYDLDIAPTLIKKRIRLHLHIDFAIGLTVFYDTLMAKSLRRELIRIRENK